MESIETEVMVDTRRRDTRGSRIVKVEELEREVAKLVSVIRE